MKSRVDVVTEIDGRVVLVLLPEDGGRYVIPTRDLTVDAPWEDVPTAKATIVLGVEV